MNRLQCVGTSSTVPSKDAEAVKAGILSSRDTRVNPSVRSKPQPQKPNPSTRPEGQQPAVIAETRRDKGNVDGSETHPGLQALTPADPTKHKRERSPRHSGLICSDNTMKEECVQNIHEPVVQVPQYLKVPKCGSGQSTSEAESRNEEECDEEDEDMAEFCAPIELLAEFLKAVMEKNYTLAKKLCQMILIYEPENPEAKNFLPLIEERLLIEESQEASSSDVSTSDDDDNERRSDSGDEDHDDIETCTDSDGENSCSSSSGSEEEDINQW